jgi:hypothetical protein
MRWTRRKLARYNRRVLRWMKGRHDSARLQVAHPDAFYLPCYHETQAILRAHYFRRPNAASES